MKKNTLLFLLALLLLTTLITSCAKSATPTGTTPTTPTTAPPAQLTPEEISTLNDATSDILEEADDITIEDSI